MLNSSKLVGFIATTKPDAALKFYQSVLGLELMDDSPFALVFDANGTSLRIQKVANLVPAAFTALGWAVTDLATMVQALAAKGVVFERFPGLSQDGRGIWNAPGGASVAWFKDPDDNLLSLTQLPS